ncbi:hypothetical protein PAHAL_3G468200 [Panicum hallii]|uniref:Uncharacterized protein n=1 Tax=Panicum hallii TaxID=206008 RepID=A0A2T8KLL1_9POAL|nr:hypothetical protein PAHAL_3G468200 [Panicum hallii]
MIFLHGLPLWKHWYACKIGCRPWYLVPPLPPSLATSFRSMK